jgi:hypothetical protein
MNYFDLCGTLIYYASIVNRYFWVEARVNLQARISEGVQLAPILHLSASGLPFRVATNEYLNLRSKRVRASKDAYGPARRDIGRFRQHSWNRFRNRLQQAEFEVASHAGWTRTRSAFSQPQRSSAMATRKPFEDVLYYISPTLALQGDRLVHVLEANGAKEAKSMSEATHVLTDSLVFEGSQDAQKDALVTVCPIAYLWLLSCCLAD